MGDKKGECCKQILLFLDSSWEVMKVSNWPGRCEMFLEILHDHTDFMSSCKFPGNYFAKLEERIWAALMNS